MLKNCAVDFVKICTVCTRKVIIKAAKRIFNSDKICRSYCDFYFGVTFVGTHCRYKIDQWIDLKQYSISLTQPAARLGEYHTPAGPPVSDEIKNAKREDTQSVEYHQLPFTLTIAVTSLWQITHN